MVVSIIIFQLQATGDSHRRSPVISPELTRFDPANDAINRLPSSIVFRPLSFVHRLSAVVYRPS